MSRYTKKRSQNWYYLLSLAILLLAVAARSWDSGLIPPGLAQDEVLNADIVESIRGGQHALFFREGFGHEPAYHYWSVPFQVLLGDNAVSIRVPALFMALLGVALTLRWARSAFGNRVALVAGGLLAVCWWAIIFGRLGLRPIMLPTMLLVTAVTWRKQAIVAGLALALGAYTYTPGVVMLALPLLLLILGVLGRMGSKERNRLLVMQTVALLAYLPLFLTLRADPTLLERGSQLSGPATAAMQGDYQPLLDNVVATLRAFGWTGDPRWTYTIANRPIMPAVVGALLLSGILSSLFRLKQSNARFVLAAFLLGILPSVLTPDAPSTIRMIGALPFAMVLISTGVNRIIRRLRFLIPPTPITVAALGLFIVGIVGYDAWQISQEWPQTFEARQKYQAVLTEIAADIQSSIYPAIIMDNFYEPIDGDTVRRATNASIPVRWVQLGNALVVPDAATGQLYVPEAMPVAPQLLAASGTSAQPIRRSIEQPGYAVYALGNDSTLTQLPQPINFGSQLQLLAVGIVGRDEQSNRLLMTQWSVQGPLPSDLSIFVHMRDSAENMVAQHDGLDAVPHTLMAGDIVYQLHRLPTETVPANTVLQIGVYQRESGTRLLLEDSADFYSIHLP